MPDPTDDALRASYDRVAPEYARRLADALRHKPFDRDQLDAFADAVRPLGPACDLGCGPGHVAGYLHGRGLEVVGVDLSPGMLDEARRLHPGLAFRQGDMRALAFDDATFGGVAAFYSVLHVPRAGVAAAFREAYRVLRPGGILLLAFHVGEATVHLDAWWEHPVSVDFHFWPTDAVVGLLCEAGFDPVEAAERDPYPDVEYPSRRAYVRATRPGGGDQVL